MDRLQPVTNEGIRHPLRRDLPLPEEQEEVPVKSRREDIVFFLVSFASAFIILYGFIL
jgi:NADH:ubiquinone oxidoreductase subunit C